MGHLIFCLRLVEAAVLGGLVGLERELAGKHAGLRTNLLICVGSALLTQVSLALPANAGGGDPGRSWKGAPAAAERMAAIVRRVTGAEVGGWSVED